MSIAGQLFQAAAQQRLRLENGVAAAAAAKIAALRDAEIPGAVRLTEYQLIRVIDHAAIREKPAHAESLAPAIVSAESLADTLDSLSESAQQAVRRRR
ncbi:MAG: hypothetical protein H7Z10_11360 [Gemmatimonadaceae bacterium]|nr:hypothetical protein [Acetobacteraceae bacterium]